MCGLPAEAERESSLESVGVRVVGKEEGKEVIKELGLMFFHSQATKPLPRLLVWTGANRARWERGQMSLPMPRGERAAA